MLRSTDEWVGTDGFTRAGVKAHDYTLHEHFPVANTTARAQHVTDLGTDGVTISASNPVRVYRSDAPAGAKHEVSEDGSTWYSVETPVFTTDGARTAQPRIVRYQGTPTTSASGDLTFNLSSVLSEVHGVHVVHYAGPRYLVPCVVDGTVSAYVIRLWDTGAGAVVASTSVNVRIVFLGIA